MVTQENRKRLRLDVEQSFPEFVRPKKLADMVYENILKQVMNGAYPAGDRLPSETELSAFFSVSRPIVREALSRLRSDGIVVSRQGSGTYVQRRPNRALFAVAPTGSIPGLMRTFEFRLALECEAAALAAVRRTSKDLVQISRAYDDLEAAIRNQQIGVEADISFHVAIAQATKNELFYRAMEVLSPQISNGITTARELSLRVSAARLRRVQEEHEAILAHIRDSHPEGARDAMFTHLESARTRVLTESSER